MRMRVTLPYSVISLIDEKVTYIEKKRKEKRKEKL
jgi:hypothetical protein